MPFSEAEEEALPSESPEDANGHWHLTSQSELQFGRQVLNYAARASKAIGEQYSNAECMCTRLQ